MHRIDHATATASNTFTGGDPTTGVAPTVVTADWLNAVQEELAAFAELGGPLDKGNNGQIAAMFANSFQGGNYQRFPGGLIFQWAGGLGYTNQWTTWTYPIAFPNAAISAWGHDAGDQVLDVGTQVGRQIAKNLTQTSLEFSANAGCYLFVIGY